MLHSSAIRTLIRRSLQFLFTPFVLRDYLRFRARNTRKDFTLRFRDFYPQIKDKTVGTSFDRHYVYHTAWAARKVKELSPPVHVDISSSLYFCGIVSAFVPVEFYDYRPADLALSNLSSAHADLTALPFPDGSLACVSCMHTVEHIGLGRYGDPIDPDAHLAAVRELIRVTREDGHIIFVVPLGDTARIEFNAHRIFTYDLVLSAFEGLELVEFSLIPEHSGPMILNASPDDVRGERFACGCFLFRKPAASPAV